MYILVSLITVTNLIPKNYMEFQKVYGIMIILCSFMSYVHVSTRLNELIGIYSACMKNIFVGITYFYFKSLGETLSSFILAISSKVYN